jgi:hypothetical protein
MSTTRVRRGRIWRSQLPKVYSGLLVGVALIGTAEIGTLALTVVTDVGYLAYRVLKPGMTP